MKIEEPVGPQGHTNTTGESTEDGLCQPSLLEKDTVSDDRTIMESGALDDNNIVIEEGHADYGESRNDEDDEFQPLVVSELPLRRKVFVSSKGTVTCQERLASCCTKAIVVQRKVLRSTITFMAFLARVLFWVSLVATSVGVFWYSRELFRHGTEAHLIAWFSAGAFVILGFPISIYGIISHLSNYYEPSIQCYVVRILWMVPLYSVGSWLCLRYHEYAIFIETVRDFYESFVLYCFLHFLIEALGGEESLILMLKDKSPTRGAHMWGLQWCMKPWIMGQPVSRTATNVSIDGKNNLTNTTATGPTTGSTSIPQRQTKRVRWTSPFFVRCKFGVLQYVLLKFVSAILIFALEINGLYNEGNFTPKGGYLYICMITNLSQCWALYCMILFYYATKNELGPIRPVGKFLSVKAIVFFTWWQSVFISILFEMGVFHNVKIGGKAVPTMSDQGEVLTNSVIDWWSPEDVAKGLQDYLICIEMFIAAIVHHFVFPHTEYTNLRMKGRNGWLKRKHSIQHKRIIGRKGMFLKKDYNKFKSSSATHASSDDFSQGSKTSAVKKDFDEELTDFAPVIVEDVYKSLSNESSKAMGNVGSVLSSQLSSVISENLSPFLDPTVNDLELTSQPPKTSRSAKTEDIIATPIEYTQSDDSNKTKAQQRTGFVRALIDSTVPHDIMDNTVGLARGDFRVEKRTLLYHAANTDEYNLFSKNRKRTTTSDSNHTKDKK